MGNYTFLRQACWKPYILRGYSQFKNVLVLVGLFFCDINDSFKKERSVDTVALFGSPSAVIQFQK